MQKQLQKTIQKTFFPDNITIATPANDHAFYSINAFNFYFFPSLLFESKHLQYIIHL